MAFEREIQELVGPIAFVRGMAYLQQGRVLDHRWYGVGRHLFGTVAGSRQQPYSVNVIFDAARQPVSGACSCPVHADCKHVAALLLAALAGDDAQSLTGREVIAPWQQALAELVHDSQQSGDQVGLGLQFELVGAGSSRSGPGLETPRLGIRPVTPGKNGRWVRTGVSWRDVSYLGRYGRSRHPVSQERILREVFALLTAEEPPYLRENSPWLFLDGASATLWTLLDEAAQQGMALIRGDQSPLPMLPEPVRASIDLAEEAQGLQLRPMLDGAEGVIDSTAVGFMGDPAHGLYYWTDSESPQADWKGVDFSLARLRSPMANGTCRFFSHIGGISVPKEDRDAFVSGTLPLLHQRVELVSHDESFVFPELPSPTLWLVCAFLPEHRVDLTWGWQYADPGTKDAGQPTADSLLPLWPEEGSAVYRDAATEVAIVADVSEISQRLRRCQRRHEVKGDGIAYRPAETQRLAPSETVDFASQELPVLRDIDGLQVRIIGDPLDYRAADDDVQIELSTTQGDTDRDWFDLAVSITIDSEKVTFTELFSALATGQPSIILPSGRYFALGTEKFDQLRTLIEEARLLQDKESETLRISRYQAGLWEELQQLGIVTAQAEAWRQTVGALVSGEIEPQPIPDGFTATLRPYQHHGFDWLSFLFQAGLGGVLADDMGLGKTVQALALIMARQPAAGKPFLVVAPTSVVGNWAAEAARFAPGLRVVAISETRARRGTELAEACREVDLVITSYALFRLEFDAYAELEWAALILDEAQFVKNRQSIGYQNARKLAAPFKLAITGTPMENSLMDLWSMFSIVAPGLFSGPEKFGTYYRKPIEKQGDTDLLDRLRRRIRPLMLRRTKEQVAIDLPAKQEQVIEVELNPRHRRAYDTFLHRERQKILGLIGDLDKNRFTIFRSLTLLRQASLDVSLIDEAHGSVAASKLDVLFDLLDDVLAEGHTTLIFSQFTSFLARVRDRLDARGTDYCYLGGKTRQRGKVLERFRTGAVPVFLISLKAGGVGLNLTEADYCILLDPWWNPATEAQAIDRTHRIGQTRQVMVYRLVARDTIEEKVMALKSAKAKLFSSVMADGAHAGAGISAADIRALLE